MHKLDLEIFYVQSLQLGLWVVLQGGGMNVISKMYAEDRWHLHLTAD